MPPLNCAACTTYSIAQRASGWWTGKEKKTWTARLWRQRAVGKWGWDIQGYGMFGGSSVVVCEGPSPQRGGASRRINGRGLWWGEAKQEEGGLRAIVAGCNQSSANTGAHSHTYYAPAQRWWQGCPRSPSSPRTWHTHSDNPLQGAKGASQSASRHSSSRTQAHVRTHTHTHVDSQLFFFPALIVRRLNRGWEEVECVPA